jgi:hypothetical protein
MLIAMAFLAPVVFFTVLNVLAFRTRGYEPAVKPVAAAAPQVVQRVPATVTVEAANDSEIREAA